MNNLVLTTRLDLMKKNLKKVEEILDPIQKQREEIQRLLDLLWENRDASMLQLLDSLEDSITASKRCLYHVRPKNQEVEKLTQHLKNAEKTLDGIYKHLESARESVESRKNRFVRINNVEETLQMELMNKAKSYVETLNQISNEVVEADRESEDRARNLMKQAWKSYIEDVYEGSHPIFAEYVDFLRGIALRETGSELHKICRTADELITGFKGIPINWKSVTIPAHEEEALSMTLARIIRLGFPEWSLWALPLAAHEFGHIVVKKNSDLESLVESEPYIEDYLADAFATYVMGPAYVCSAILLRLNPFPTSGGKKEYSTGAARAFVVFETLKHMNSTAPRTERPYTKIIRQLEDAWDDARKQAGFDEVLQNEDKDKLDEGKLKGLVESIGHFLYEESLVVYSRKNWTNMSTKWASKLLTEPEGIEVNGSEDLRDVINAAWLCRLNNSTKPEADIHEAAEGLWSRILKAREASDGDGQYGQGSRSQ